MSNKKNLSLFITKKREKCNNEFKRGNRGTNPMDQFVSSEGMPNGKTIRSSDWQDHA